MSHSIAAAIKRFPIKTYTLGLHDTLLTSETIRFVFTETTVYLHDK